MGIRVKSIRDGIEYEGYGLEYILDEEMELGEVYLDETLIFQSDEVYTERQLQQDFNNNFKTEEISDDLVGIEDSEIDYNIEGVASGLFTHGGEYMTSRGAEYIGDYHIHEDGTAMQGKFHMEDLTARAKYLSTLKPMLEEDVVAARENGQVTNIDYTIDEDVFPWIGVDRNPIELTDEELLEEDRKIQDQIRFGIENEKDINDKSDKLDSSVDTNRDY